VPRILANVLLPALLALAGARPAGAETWTLDRVLDAMRRADPGVRAIRAAGEAARAEGAGELGALSPRITLQAGLVRGDDPALRFTQKLQQGRFTAADFALDELNQPPAGTGLQWGLLVEQPLWNGGAEVTAPGLAGHRRGAARATEHAALADRLLEAVGRYVNAVRARAALAAESAARLAAENYRDAAVERLQQGQVSPLDSMRAAARLGESRLRWLGARQAADLALARLAALVGAEVAESDLAELPDPAAASAREPSPRGELVAARENAAALATESRRSGLRLLPSLNSRFTVTRYRDLHVPGWEERWTAAVLLDLPLWDGTRRIQDWRAARARARAAREGAERLERDLAVELDAARTDAELALERRAVARETHAAAEEALRFATARYRAGLLPLTDLLATDADAARARQARVESDAEAVMAHYRLMRARGELR